jgi:hypothetical protein
MDVSGRITWSFRKGSPSESNDASLLYTIGMTTDEKRSPYGFFPDAPAAKIKIDSKWSHRRENMSYASTKSKTQ